MNWNVAPMQRISALDLTLCHRFKRACECVPARRFFAVFSWLGDGKFWYALMLLLPAVMLTIIVCASFPSLVWGLLPFTALVAASRVILGLHYPTDMLLGACIGASLAVAMPLIPLS